MTTTRTIANVAVCITIPLLFTACSAEDYSRRADRIARNILETEESAELGARYETVSRPGERDTDSPEVEGADSGPPPVVVGPIKEPRILNLAEALELAVRGNRDQQARREDLYLQVLSLASVRNQFSPQLSLTLSYLFADDHHLEATHGAVLSAGFTQILPWGGTVSGNLISDYLESDSDGSFTTSAGIALTQPLLRGSGARISHEALIQAERSVIYAIRDFELAREDFSIDVARRYYDLVQRKQTIDNLQRNLEGLEFGRRQAEALFRVGRTKELDVLRARRSELGARDTLIGEIENNQLALDRFRIFLGLDRDTPVDVLEASPEYVAVEYSLEEAVEVALENRLDLITRKQQLEDVARGLAIAEDNLRADLTFRAGFGASARDDPSFVQQVISRDALTAGLTLDLPVNRVDEQNAYRSAQISSARAQRNFEQFRDDLIVQIASSYRELVRRRQSFEIQRELMEGQEKNVKIAQIRFEQGDISNRDVVEAKESLLEARNSQINERVNYEISRLGLLRNLGILFIDEKGMFQE